MLHALTDHLMRGRWEEIASPAPRSCATLVLEIAIEAASAKVRVGPPVDDEEDYSLSVWAGVLPLKVTPGNPSPIPDFRPSRRCLIISRAMMGRNGRSITARPCYLTAARTLRTRFFSNSFGN